MFKCISPYYHLLVCFPALKVNDILHTRTSHVTSYILHTRTSHVTSYDAPPQYLRAIPPKHWQFLVIVNNRYWSITIEIIIRSTVSSASASTLQRPQSVALYIYIYIYIYIIYYCKWVYTRWQWCYNDTQHRITHITTKHTTLKTIHNTQTYKNNKTHTSKRKSS
jgi:hypothetical protein